MTNKELLELRATREKLEKETKVLIQKQKTLEDTVCILEEMASIQELEMEIKSLKDAISKLEVKEEELESKLGKKSVNKKAEPKGKKASKKLEDRKPEMSDEVNGEKDGSDITIATVVYSNEVKQKPVQKKKRFF